MWHEYGGHFWGMHWVWWVLWLLLLLWIFVTPWEVPGQRTRKESPLDILKRRYASGEITSEEFGEMKKTLLKDE